MIDDSWSRVGSFDAPAVSCFFCGQQLRAGDREGDDGNDGGCLDRENEPTGRSAWRWNGDDPSKCVILSSVVPVVAIQRGMMLLILPIAIAESFGTRTAGREELLRAHEKKPDARRSREPSLATVV